MDKNNKIGTLHVGVKNSDFEFAKKLRQNQTPAEKILWERLRRKQLCGAKFRRQHPIGGFFVDFYCHQSKLVVELDGSVHDETGQQEYDLEREQVLTEVLELKVIRLRNKAVYDDVENVLKIIEKHL